MKVSNYNRMVGAIVLALTLLASVTVLRSVPVEAYMPGSEPLLSLTSNPLS